MRRFLGVHGRARRAVIIVAAFGGVLVAASNAAAVLPGPNGKIVFTSGRDDGLTPFSSANAQLWVAPRAGATPVRVTVNPAIQHRHANWSPDRTKLVYSAGPGSDWDIWILDVTKPSSGTNPVDITNSPGVADDRPSWSPDGTRVAYQSKNGANPAQIVVQSVTGPPTTTTLTEPKIGDAGKPVWTPDSSTIYYSLVVGPGPDDDIYRKAADNSGVATPVVTGSNDDYQPALSPDGQSLCFTRGGFGTPQATVQRSTVTGTDVVEIVASGLGDYNCAWSPDGTRIAYVQGTFTNGDLMVMNSDATGVPTDLVPNVAGRFDGNPDWTRNPSPTCQDRSVTVPANVTTSIPLTCSDPPPENDPITRSIVAQPSHGRVAPLAGTATTAAYTPARNFSGRDTFAFKANDGTSDSNVATIHVTVRDAPAVISSLTVAPSRWRVSTHISFRLSKPAKVTLTFAKAATGRKVAGHCVAPRRSNRSRPHCTRFLTAGHLSFGAHGGRNRVRFQGRLSRTRKLTPGSYLLTVTAVDAAGSRSRARTAKFTIVH
jgi:Tol biopolymer transport system component